MAPILDTPAVAKGNWDGYVNTDLVPSPFKLSKESPDTVTLRHISQSGYSLNPIFRTEATIQTSVDVVTCEPLQSALRATLEEHPDKLIYDKQGTSELFNEQAVA